MVAQVAGFLLPMRETRIEILALGFGLSPAPDTTDIWGGTNTWKILTVKPRSSQSTSEPRLTPTQTGTRFDETHIWLRWQEVTSHLLPSRGL